MNLFLVIILAAIVFVLPGIGLMLYHFHLGEQAIGKAPMGDTRYDMDVISRSYGE
jgi:hypothetical protein